MKKRIRGQQRTEIPAIFSDRRGGIDRRATVLRASKQDSERREPRNERRTLRVHGSQQSWWLLVNYVDYEFNSGEAKST